MFAGLLQNPIQTMGNFAREYLMVVLGVLTALGLGQWVVQVKQGQDAATASTQIDAELRANIADIRDARKVDLDHLKYFTAVRDDVIHDFRAHLPEADIARHILARTNEGVLPDARWPVLHHEAWDVAVANQSASWIDNGHMRLYAAAYASIRTADDRKNVDVSLIMDDSHLLDVMADMEIGRVQPHQFLYTISRITMMLHDTEGRLRTLDETLGRALPAGDLHAQATGRTNLVPTK